MKILLTGIVLLWTCLPSPAWAATGSAAALVGSNTCDVSFRRSHSGVFEDFEKDPGSFQLGEIMAGGKRYVVAVEKESEKRNGCGKIIAAMEVERPLDNEHGEGIGFNCAVLKQRYDRYKSYLGIFQADALEYTRAKMAWVFDFSSLTFQKYARPENVYCANFIAD